MLNSSTIRFATDTFGLANTFTKQALLVSKVPLDCTAKTAVNQIVITGNEPTGSARCVIFKIDDALYYFQNGTLTAYPYEGKFDDVISNGNDVSTLTAINNISAFVGKKIYPIIALQAPSDATEFPTIKIALDTSTSTGQLTNTIDSPVYEIDTEPRLITKITADTVIKGQASVNVTVRLRNQEVWTNYMSFEQAAGLEADAVQFKAQYSVTTAGGTDSAQIKQIAVTYSSGENIVTDADTIIFSKVQNYGVDLQTCYVVVHHDPLIDAEIKAYVNFMPEPKHRELIQIGMGTGSRQEYTLGNPDKNIVPTSIRLYQDDQPLYDFDFSAELSTVVLTAKKNSVITASYNYKYGVEEWLEMNPRLLQPYNDADGTYASRFYLNLSASDALGKRISNVMIRLKKLSGKATESLGEATGKKQLFTLQHKAKPSTISFTGTVDFSYDEESGILSLVASKGTALNVSYNWQGENITVHSFAAGWVPNTGIDYQEGDTSISGGDSSSEYLLPTMAPNVKGGAKVGANLYMTGDTLNAQAGFFRYAGFVCFPSVRGDDTSWSVADYEQDFQSYIGRASQNYDVVYWNDSGSVNGWAIRVDDKWINLGTDTYDAQWQLESGWNLINPLLSLADRKKLNSLADIYQIGDGFYRSDEYGVGGFELDDKSGVFLNSRALFQFFKDFSVFRGAIFPDDSSSRRATEFAIEDLETDFVNWYGRASRVGDIISFYADPGSGEADGYAYRAYDKWIVLGYEGSSDWENICPLLTIEDRQKLDAINAQIDAWQYKGKFNNRPDSSDEDDTDIAIYLQCEDNDTFPDGSAPEVGYYSLQDIPFTYYDMAFHNDDLLFYLPLANGSKKWFVMQSAANYRDYYTYRHPTILPDYPARGTENTNDKRPPEGNLWFDEDGKLHLAGKDYNLYTFTPDPPANSFSANLSLTENDRKLLDFLHQQFDSQIP